MAQCTNSLINKIDQDIEYTKDNDGYGTVDIWGLFQRLALDVIGETAFGKSFDMIENNNHPIPGAIAAGMRNSTIRLMFPLLSRFLIKGEDPDKIIKVVSSNNKKKKWSVFIVLIVFRKYNSRENEWPI